MGGCDNVNQCDIADQCDTCVTKSPSVTVLSTATLWTTVTFVFETHRWPSLLEKKWGSCIPNETEKVCVGGGDGVGVHGKEEEGGNYATP